MIWLLVVAVAVAGSSTRAQAAELSPAELSPVDGLADAQLPPVHPTLPATSNGPAQRAQAALARRPNGFEGRHSFGVQIGGSGIVQAVYRLRALGPVHLEVGAFGADHGSDLSAGVLVGFPVANRWFPYLGFGGGMMWIFGPKNADGCDPKTTDCPTVDSSETLAFLHLRVGVGCAFGATRRHLLSLDVGGWRGAWSKNEGDTAGNQTHSSGRVVLPMAGASYFFRL